jgi:hypothetical protein
MQQKTHTWNTCSDLTIEEKRVQDVGGFIGTKKISTAMEKNSPKKSQKQKEEIQPFHLIRRNVSIFIKCIFAIKDTHQSSHPKTRIPW